MYYWGLEVLARSQTTTYHFLSVLSTVQRATEISTRNLVNLMDSAAIVKDCPTKPVTFL